MKKDKINLTFLLTSTIIYMIIVLLIAITIKIEGILSWLSAGGSALLFFIWSNYLNSKE